MGSSRTMGQQRQRGRHGDVDSAANTDPDTVSVHVPLAFRQRRGRKVFIAPDGTGQAPLSAGQSPTRIQAEVTPTVRALARAFRWRKHLETGAVATVHELAAAENINPSYVSRVLRLTLLAPAIVEATLEGASDIDASLDRLMLPFAVEWEKQKSPSYPRSL